MCLISVVAVDVVMLEITSGVVLPYSSIWLGPCKLDIEMETAQS